MYTIERSGANWVASNGENNVEHADPVCALTILLSAEIGEPGDVQDGIGQERAADAELGIGVHCLTLVRLLAIGEAPEELLHNEVAVISRMLDEYLAYRGPE